LANIPVPSAQTQIAQDGIMTTTFQRWVTQVSTLGIIAGAGSPEGVVEASQTKLYMDTSGASGSILYIKRDTDILGDRTKGWILV
jgi:hypothetical protein